MPANLSKLVYPNANGRISRWNNPKCLCATALKCLKIPVPFSMLHAPMPLFPANLTDRTDDVA